MRRIGRLGSCTWRVCRGSGLWTVELIFTPTVVFKEEIIRRLECVYRLEWNGWESGR